MRMIVFAILFACACAGTVKIHAMALMTYKDAEALAQQGIKDPWNCRPSAETQDTREARNRGEPVWACWECREGNKCLPSGGMPVAPKPVLKAIPRHWIEEGL